MTATLFEKWFANLLPLAKEEAEKHERERVVIVMDNAAYHGRFLEEISLKREKRGFDYLDAPAKCEPGHPVQVLHRKRGGFGS